MTIRHRAGAAIAALSICLSTPTAAQQPTRLPGSFITGQVLSANNNAPLRRVRLDVSRGTWTAEPVLTDNDGRFSIDLERTGPVSVTATKGGYLVAKTTVQPADISRPLRMNLLRGAVITGTAFDDQGQPAVATSVWVKRLDPAVDGFPAESSTSTDDRGDYRLAGLAPGRYELMAGVNIPSVVRPTPPDPGIVIVVAAGDEIGGVQVTIPFSRTMASIQRATTEAVQQNPALSARLLPSAERVAAGTGGIRGRVLTSARKPVVGAAVKVTGPASYFTRNTDVSGGFSITGLRPGRYTLEATANGLGTWGYGQDGPGRASTPIVIADRIEEGIDIVLPQHLAIQGVVVDEDGEPVQGARVQPLQVDYASDRLLAVPAGREQRTDDRGAYRLWGLAAGRYLLSASVDGLFADGRGGRTTYAAMYYPGTPVIANASTIDLREDTTINLAFAPLTLMQITGKGRYSEGPLIGGSVRLVESRRPGAVSMAPRTAPIQGDGSFIIRNVPPGDYVLHVRGDGPGRTGMFATEAVSVGSNPIDLVVRTSYGASLEGRAMLEGTPEAVGCRSEPVLTGSAITSGGCGIPQPVFTVSPVALDDRARAEATIVFGWSANQFFGSGLFGRYSFALKGAPDDNWYLKSLTINGTDITDAGFDFGTEPVAISGADIVLSHNGASVSGRLADTHGSATGYSVVVFPPSYDRLPPLSRRVKFTRSANDGSFRISGLPAGDYLVAAVPRLQGNEGQNPEVLQQLASRAEHVSLSQGQSATVSLRLIER